MGLSNSNKYSIVPESDKTVTVIAPSTNEEAIRDNFLLKTKSHHLKKPVSQENVQLRGLDDYLTEEDFVEIERSGSDMPDEDKTVSTIKPGSSQEHNLEDYLMQKNDALVKRALTHQREEVFVQEQVEEINNQIIAEKTKLDMQKEE